MQNELKPCPFCGNSVELWETGFGVVKVIECKTCNVRFVFPWHKDTKKELTDAWNRRANNATD